MGRLILSLHGHHGEALGAITLENAVGPSHGNDAMRGGGWLEGRYVGTLRKD